MQGLFNKPSVYWLIGFCRLSRNSSICEVSIRRVRPENTQIFRFFLLSIASTHLRMEVRVTPYLTTHSSTRSHFFIYLLFRNYHVFQKRKIRSVIIHICTSFNQIKKCPSILIYQTVYKY